VPDGAKIPDPGVANALPQALILTAIVIGFGLLAFALALAFRAWQSLGTVVMDDMRACEPVEPDAKRGEA
jgi:multicomponent Na+:H+ antiporter subunit C